MARVSSHLGRGSARGGKVESEGSCMLSIIKSIWYVFLHAFQKRVTVQYPEQKAYLAPRYRGRIILSRDPDGQERCVACYLCAAACPVDCISLQAASGADN